MVAGREVRRRSRGKITTANVDPAEAGSFVCGAERGSRAVRAGRLYYVVLGGRHETFIPPRPVPSIVVVVVVIRPGDISPLQGSGHLREVDLALGVFGLELGRPAACLTVAHLALEVALLEPHLVAPTHPVARVGIAPQ